MTTEFDEGLLTWYLVCLLKKREKEKNQRSIWTKKWLQKRKVYSHVNLMKDLLHDSNEWRNYMRMDETAYAELLALVTPTIARQDTVMREAISPHERLSCTLRFLATGRSYKDLRFSTAISTQAISEIIPDTCKAIIGALKEKYMKIPETPEEWKKIAEEFEKRWNFPHCLGAIDGKHVRIVPPPGSGSYFFNYKKFHSMVLMAVVNANYEFIVAEFGANGRISDGGVIECTVFYKKLVNKSLCIPHLEKLNNSNKILNYVFIGDEAFSLSPNFLKPYAQKEITTDRRIYNYRLSRARRVVENAFGILAARFRIYHTSINLRPDNIDAVVLATCSLHNFLRKKHSNSYTPPGSLDYEHTIEGSLELGLRTTDSDLCNLQSGHYKSISKNAKDTRDKFSQFFNNEGSVPWQNKMCNLE